VVSILQAKGSAKNVWEQLEKTYRKDNLQAKLNISGKLQTIKFDENTDIQDHLNALQKHFLEIARLNDTVSDQDKVAFLLRSLPPSFSNIASVSGATNQDYDGDTNMVKAELGLRESQTPKLKHQAFK